MLEQITPLILTHNEALNIGRTLEQLRWAREVVVVDSLSDDATLEVAGQFVNTRVVQREFDTFAAQWSFGLSETGIATEWVLGIDADFVLTPESIDELRELQPAATVDAYRAPITYCVYGHRLRSGLIPPLKVLYRRSSARFTPDGHTYQISVDGNVELLRSPILHDDRKPLRRWVRAQSNYTALEGDKLLAADLKSLSFPDRIRRLRVFAPFAISLYCLIYRGGVLDGWPGFFYALQRMFAEILLSLYLIEHDLKLRQPATKPRGTESKERTANPPLAVGKQPDTIG